MKWIKKLRDAWAFGILPEAAKASGVVVGIGLIVRRLSA
jgi:hypothetical protein